MGYSASSVQEDLITLPRDKVQEIWEGLRQAEEVGGIGHISWCDTIASGRYPETMEGVVQILSDYGFNVDLDNEGNVDLYSWGGDKLGSSWNHIWGFVIAPFVTEPAKWVMIGEDGMIWAVVLDGKGGFTERDVKVEVT